MGALLVLQLIPHSCGRNVLEQLMRARESDRDHSKHFRRPATCAGSVKVHLRFAVVSDSQKQCWKIRILIRNVEEFKSVLDSLLILQGQHEIHFEKLSYFAKNRIVWNGLDFQGFFAQNLDLLEHCFSSVDAEVPETILF